MNFTKALITHNLKGINGWSKLSIDKIDVSKIIKIYYCKRSFCIRDVDYKYSLNIEYEYAKTKRYFFPIFPFSGLSFFSDTTFEQSITKRYKTENECIDEINEIEQKQKKLNNYIEKLNKQILNDF